MSQRKCVEGVGAKRRKRRSNVVGPCVQRDRNDYGCHGFWCSVCPPPPPRSFPPLLISSPVSESGRVLEVWFQCREFRL